MSEDLVDEPFKQATRKVDQAFDRAGEELKARAQEAKAEALKKVSG